MDILAAKAQLAWAAQNMQDAQAHLDDGDLASVSQDLLFAERAFTRVREMLAEAKIKHD